MTLDHDRRSALKSILLGAVASTRLARAATATESKPAPAKGGASPPTSSVPSAEPAASPKAAASRATVFRARRDTLLGADRRCDLALLEAALGAAAAGACGAGSAEAGFKRMFKASDVVGIKVNCIAGKSLSSRPETVGLLVKWLQSAGLPARNILIWDRTDRELVRAGFELNRSASGVRVFGTEDDYDWKPREWGPNASCFARLLVEDITALINVGVLKDHDLAGVALGMKSWYGAIHNPNKCHDDRCAPFIPHLAAYPLIRDKLRLTVIDGVTGQCHGGPGAAPKWSWPYQGVLASTDPVAMDAVGWKILEEQRSKVGLPSLTKEKRAPVWIAAAAKLGVGEAELDRIRVEDV